MNYKLGAIFYYTFQLVVFCSIFQKASGVSLCKNRCKSGIIKKGLEGNPSEMKTEKKRHIMKKGTNEMKCQRGWFTKSWRPKKLSKKNLKRSVCRNDHWYVYSLKVVKEVGRCLSIRVSQWSWQLVTPLNETLKHSVFKRRSGTPLNVMRNKNVFKNRRLKGKKFLIWSKHSDFDKNTFRSRDNIQYKVTKKIDEKNTREVLRKVSWMCSRF